MRRAARELVGSPNAGVRLEVPQFLQTSLKALKSVSYALKQKNPGMKRNVKYDDSVMDHMLDFCVDPAAPDAQWRKIRPDQAALVKAKVTKNTRSEEILGADLGRLLDDDPV